jgi:hypothetical protein
MSGIEHGRVFIALAPFSVCKGVYGEVKEGVRLQLRVGDLARGRQGAEWRRGRGLTWVRVTERLPGYTHRHQQRRESNHLENEAYSESLGGACRGRSKGFDNTVRH